MAQDQARIWYQSFVHPVEQASASRFTASIRPPTLSIR